MEGSADGQGIELVFRSITPEDSGNYACEATLEGVVERAEFELKVIGEWTGEKPKHLPTSLSKCPLSSTRLCQYHVVLEIQCILYSNSQEAVNFSSHLHSLCTYVLLGRY